MFVLRKTKPSGEQTNYMLGTTYTLITAETSREDFDDFLMSSGNSSETDVYGFLLSEKQEPITMYKNELNYIMNDHGSNFANISYGGARSLRDLSR